MKRLRIGRGLSLDATEFIESKAFVVGQSGRGKSGLLKVIEEGLVKSKLPFVVFDPAGVAWGIRSSKDGKGPGLPILVIGGPHGDVRLDRRAGAQTARALVEANVSAIIDFSEEPKAAYREFLIDFCETLYAINDTSRLVVIDEAKEVVPQQIRPDQTRAFDAVERLVRQGRNKGIGVLLVSQRMATVNKDVVTQCGTLFVFGLVGKPDHKTLHDWVDEWSTEESLATFEDGLAALKPRECWIWSPQQFGLFQRTYVREFETLHPDRTHLRKMGLLTSKPVTTDVSGIVSKLSGALEALGKTKDEKTTIAKLQKELSISRYELDAARKREHPQSAWTTKGAMELERLRKVVSTFERRHRYDEERLRKASKALGDVLGGLNATASRIQLAGKALEAPYEVALDASVLPPPPTPPPERLSDEGRARLERAEEEARSGGSKKFESVDSLIADLFVQPPAGARRVLGVIVARYPTKLTRGEVSTFAGMSAKSGTFTKYLSILRKAGLIVDAEGGAMVATKAGLDFSNESPPTASTLEDVREMWLKKLPKGAGEMLAALVRSYPSFVMRYDLASVVGKSPTSGTFTKYLSILRRNGLLEESRDGVRASRHLIEGAS